MAGIVFPDLAGTLLPVMAIERQEAASRRAEEKDRREQEAGQYVSGALAGDTAAFGKLATLSPSTALALQGHLERLDTAQRAKAKDEMELSGRMAAGILSLPPDQRPAAYAAGRAQLEQMGFKVSHLPPVWDNSMEGRLRTAAALSAEGLKMLEGQPTPMPGPGGGGGSPVSSADQQAFIQTMMPHALAVSQATGLDPRLVLAQSALETGYGKAAPGNNYFGIKSHGLPGGVSRATTEYGPSGAYQTEDAFRTYQSPASSAQDYAAFLKSNSRYAPVLQAQGLDAQIDAMGRSGYATDPNYAAKLRQIAGGIQIPAGAPAPAGTPAPATVQPASDVHGVQLPPGARMVGIKGVPITKDGTVMVQMPDGSINFVPLPQRNDQPKTLEERDRETLLTGDPGSAAYAAAYAHLGSPRVTLDQQTGQMVQIMPDMGWARKPTFGQGAPAAGGEAAPGQKGVSVQPVPGLAPKMTSEQARDAGFADRMLNSNSILDKVAPQGAEVVGRLQEALPFGVGNFAQSQDYQSFKQARDDFINAQLRRESGAAISKDEYEKADRQYFPIPGDWPETIAQKAKNRALAVEAMRRGAGPAYKPSPSVGEQQPKSGAPALPKVGDVVDGYIFNGGDPSKPESWRKQ